MRTLKTLSLLILVAIFFSSCEEKDPKNNEQGEVVFNLSVKSSMLKSTLADTSKEPVSLTLSIIDSDGKAVYTMEKIELLKFNADYISKPLTLSPGKYKLTSFFVLNSSGNAIYACPVAGSPKAYLVKSPLNIEFNIATDNVTKLNPEVLSTNESKAADFGYNASSFSIVKTFDFLTTAFLYNETTKNLELTTASVNISNDSINYNLLIDAKTNQLTVKDGFASYKLTFSKTGFSNVIVNCTATELMSYYTSPLKVLFTKTKIITLQPGTEGKDAFVHSYNSSSNYGNSELLQSLCWTISGSDATLRFLIDFDLSKISSSSKISQAKLSLYEHHNATPTEGHTGANSSYIKRVTSTWDESTVTWINQPSTIETNKATMAASTSALQDYVDIDVTNLIQDIISKPTESFGIMVSLVNEQPYNAMYFASSDYTDATKHPKLVITLE